MYLHSHNTLSAKSGSVTTRLSFRGSGRVITLTRFPFDAYAQTRTPSHPTAGLQSMHVWRAAEDSSHVDVSSSSGWDA